MDIIINLSPSFHTNIAYCGMVIATAGVNALDGFHSISKTMDSTLEDAWGTVYIGSQMSKEKDL